MQKIDAMNTQVNTQVTINRNGKVYKAIVLRAPTFTDKSFRPTQFKVQVLGDDEWAGNRYVSYTAVHTAEADKNQKARVAEAEKAKAERKVSKPSKTDGISDFELLKALADRLGYTLSK